MDNLKLKILHIADYVMPALGYQEFLLPKWNAIHGHEVTLICADRYKGIRDYECKWKPVLGERLIGKQSSMIDGICLERLPTIEFKNRPWFIGLTRLVREIDPDVIWVHGTASPSAFQMALLSRKLKKPLVMDNHQCFIAARKGITGSLYHKALRLTSRFLLDKNVEMFIGCSQECCDFMTKIQGLSSNRMTVLPLGVDTNDFSRVPQLRIDTRTRLGIPPEAVVVLQTGKLDHTRRPDWLALAMAPLMQKHDNCWAMYVGGAAGHELQKLKEIFLKAKVLERVIFHNFIPQHQLKGFFNAADICVYPDYCSLSCIEAAACECAVVVNDLPTSQERADAGIGLSYRRGDIKHLNSILNSLIQDPLKRQTLGKNARDHVLKNLSYDTIAGKAEDLIREAIYSYKRTRDNSINFKDHKGES